MVDLLKLRISSTSWVHPIMRDAVRRLEMRMLDLWMAREIVGYQFLVFETYRTPQRQSDLAHPDRDGKIVTKAGPWESAHQYGLAVDFAAYIDSEDPAVIQRWSWGEQHDWSVLKREAEKCGLSVPIKWDQGHVEHPIWKKVKNTLRMPHAEVEQR